MKKLLIYHLPALLYAGLIIALSSIPNLGRKQSILYGYDKIIHFSEYALFAILIFRSISNISSKISFRLSIFISLAFIMVFAVFDEVYQSHIPGRQSDPYDALFDILGAALIVVIFAVRRRIKRNRAMIENVNNMH